MSNKVKNYWTFDKVKEEASKFLSRNEFNKLSKSAYLAAYRNGWLDDVCSHMIKRKLESFGKYIITIQNRFTEDKLK